MRRSSGELKGVTEEVLNWSLHSGSVHGSQQSLAEAAIPRATSTSVLDRVPSNNSLHACNSIHKSSSKARLDVSGEGIRGRAPSITDASTHAYNRIPTALRNMRIAEEVEHKMKSLDPAEAAAIEKAEAEIAAVIARGRAERLNAEDSFPRPHAARLPTSWISVVAREVLWTGDMPNYKAWLFRNQHTSVGALLLFWLDVVLRGVSQVYLCDHPVAGVFILAGLLCSSGRLVGYALLGTIFSTLGAWHMCRPPVSTITSGLCGYDGALVGCACFAFLDSPAYGEGLTKHVAVVVVLSLISGFVHVACSNLLQTFFLPTFTFGFNLTTMFMLLSLRTKNATVIAFAPATAPVAYPPDYTAFSAAFLWDASVRGVGQFMFADTTYGGALVILGICVSSRMGALAAWAGATVAALTACFLLQVTERDLVDVRNGLYGYNSAGTCASLAGGVFYYPSLSGSLFGLVGAAFTTLVLTMFKSVFGTLWSLPVLTFPFIVSTWIMLLTKSKLLVPYPVAQALAPPGPTLTCEERVLRFLQAQVFGGQPANIPTPPSSSSGRRGVAGLLAFFALPADDDALAGDETNLEGEV